MLKTYSGLNIFIMGFLALSFFIAGVSNAQQNSSSSLTEVEGVKVCMVTDQLFVKDQIPVELEGKTYYGCCEMCKGKLKNNPDSRVAIDPVSGNQVDKAQAVIGAAPDGSVYYFESEENLTKFKPSAIN